MLKRGSRHASIMSTIPTSQQSEQYYSNKSLHSWWDCGATVTFLGSENAMPLEQVVIPQGKTPPATFLMGFECCPVCHLCWNYLITQSGKAVSPIIGNCPANELGQAWQDITQNHHTRYGQNNLLLVKFCQKTAGNQCSQETHQPHDLSISKNNICSVKKKNPP